MALDTTGSPIGSGNNDGFGAVGSAGGSVTESCPSPDTDCNGKDDRQDQAESDVNAAAETGDPSQLQAAVDKHAANGTHFDGSYPGVVEAAKKRCLAVATAAGNGENILGSVNAFGASYTPSEIGDAILSIPRTHDTDRYETIRHIVSAYQSQNPGQLENLNRYLDHRLSVQDSIYTDRVEHLEHVIATVSRVIELTAPGQPQATEQVPAAIVDATALAAEKGAEFLGFKIPAVGAIVSTGFDYYSYVAGPEQVVQGAGGTAGDLIQIGVVGLIGAITSIPDSAAGMLTTTVGLANGEEVPEVGVANWVDETITYFRTGITLEREQVYEDTYKQSFIDHIKPLGGSYNAETDSFEWEEGVTDDQMFDALQGARVQAREDARAAAEAAITGRYLNGNG